MEKFIKRLKTEIEALAKLIRRLYCTDIVTVNASMNSKQIESKTATISLSASKIVDPQGTVVADPTELLDDIIIALTSSVQFKIFIAKLHLSYKIEHASQLVAATDEGKEHKVQRVLRFSYGE